MRYAFIVNPTAGQGGHDRGVVKNIEDVISNHIDDDIGLFYTKYSGDAISLSETLAAEAQKAGEDIVLFCCGGDGTAHEVANGIFGYDNAAIGLVPVGSGNDLCRELSREKKNYRDYVNLELQKGGRAKEIDAMKITWEEKGETVERIAINSINIGFDGNTAVRASELKEQPFISGSLAYLMAVFSTLIKKDGQSLRITADGELFYEGDLLLTTIGNGGFCGGGIRSCPFAILDDGELELMTIHDMSRFSFISKFSMFRAGRMFEINNVDKFSVYRRAKEVTVEPLLDERMKYVADGEVMDTPKISIEVLPKAIKVWEILGEV